MWLKVSDISWPKVYPAPRGEIPSHLCHLGHSTKDHTWDPWKVMRVNYDMGPWLISGRRNQISNPKHCTLNLIVNKCRIMHPNLYTKNALIIAEIRSLCIKRLCVISWNHWAELTIMMIKYVFFFLPHEEPPVFCQELLYDPKYQWMVERPPWRQNICIFKTTKKSLKQN